MMKKIGFFLLLLGISLSGFSQSDFCATATQLFPTLTECTYESGSSNAATQSRPGCSGLADDDVWYYFIANSTDMTVQVDPSGGYDAVFDLYDGNCAGSVVNSVCRDVLGDGLNEKYLYTGLTIGNSYYLRIYHAGAGSGTDAFRVCVYGVPAPTNVFPCLAYALPSPTPACNFQTYELVNSPTSSVPVPTSCTNTGDPNGGYAGGDMWFKVEVPSSGNLEISTLGIDWNDGGMGLYQGANCSALSLINCNGNRSGSSFMPYIYETGLTPGDTMYIRIWEWNNNQNGKFKICVSTPDNFSCPTALNLCDINGYGGTTSDKYPVDNPDNMRGKDELPAGGVFGIGYTGMSPVQIDNNSWIVFQAASTSASFNVDIEDCLNGNGIQMQIFSGTNCTGFAPVSNFLETSTSQVITATGLTAGNSYYIVIDGFAGDVCSYTVTANSGVQTVTASATDLSFCVGNSTTVTANVFGGGSYTYTWYSVPAGGPYGSGSSITDSPTTDIEYFVDITGACGGVTTASVKVFVRPIPTAPSVSASQTTICPNGSSSITASGTLGARYDVFSAATGGTALGSTPYTFNANGFSGSTTLYVETVTPDTCTSPTRTPVTINSSDVIAPSITCPQNQVVNLDASCNYTIPNYLTSTTVTDNCYDTVTNVTQSPVAGTVISGHNFNQTVTITAVDSSGNPSNCSFIVNTQDVTPPIMSGPCPNDTIVLVDNNCSFIIPDFTGAFTTTDNCTTTPNIIYSQQPAAGDTLSGVGTTQTIYIIAIDGANNRDTCEFLATLQDTTPATITCPNDFTDTTDLEDCAYLVPDFSSFITLNSDNCSNGGGSANITQTPAIGTPIDITEDDVPYLVTITYTDASMNQSQCTFTVTAACVRDIVIPEFISPNGDGSNDYFVIENLTAYPSNDITIFNRWGNLVYKKDNYDNTWDGKANVKSPKLGSSFLPNGVYYYILTIPDQEEFTGFVYIERN